MKVFVVTYGGGHANIIKYIVPELLKVTEVEILALTVAPQIFDREGIRYKQLSDYAFLFEDEFDDIRKYGEELAKTEYNPNAGMLYDESVLYLGLGFCDMLNELGSEMEAKKNFQQKGRKAFCPKRTMRKILEYVEPNILICTTDVRYEKAAGIVANELKIKVVRIHDLIELKSFSYDAYLFVMNDYAKKHAIESNGISSDRIYVTGQPCFEYDLLPNNDKDENTRRKFNIDKYKKVIVYLEQPMNRDIEIVEKFLEEQAKENEDNLYIVKLHPNQDFSEDIYANNNFVKIKKWDLQSLLRLSNLAITCDSTSGLEAALMGKPLIVIGIKNEIQADFSQYGIAIKVNTVDELERAIKNIDSPVIKRNLEEARRNFKNKENASQNIIDSILKLVCK